MLKRVHIKGYKSLHDVEVELTPLTVLFGRNATGKSNFLEALQLLARLGTSRTLKEAFDPPLRGQPLESFSFGEQGLQGLRERSRVSLAIEADLCLSDATVAKVNQQLSDMQQMSANGSRAGARSKTSAQVRERNLRYRIAIEMKPKQDFLSVADESLVALTAKGEPAKNRKPFIERQRNQLCLRSEGKAQTARYDRHLDHSILSKACYLPDNPHLAAVKQELASWLFYDFKPSECMRAATPVKEEVSHIGLAGENLAAYLYALKVRAPKQFWMLEQSMHLFMPELTEIDVTVNESGEAELWFKEAGGTMSARVVSEGILRILGLVALVGTAEPPALIALEEPEASISPRCIELIGGYLMTRTYDAKSQYIVTTNSPVLPDYLSKKYLQVVTRPNGQTLIDPIGAWGPVFKWPAGKKPADALEYNERLVSERILRGDFDA